MNFLNERVYIAAPFFTPDQLRVVMNIEDILKKYNIEFFSPRQSGTIKEMTEEERRMHMRHIYDENVTNVERSMNMIAVIDDYDTGTVFELGYATAMKVQNRMRKIITLTSKDYDLNVMLKFSVDCHLKSFASLALMIEEMISTSDKSGALSRWDTNPLADT